MLHGRLALHNLQDTEALCSSIIHKHPPSIELPGHEREDLLAFLVETAWELSLDYQPDRNPNGHNHPAGGFAGYAAHILKRRIVDWHRQRPARTGYRSGTEWKRLPPLDSLDDQDTASRPHPRGHLDPHEHRDPDLLRVLRSKGRRPSWLDPATGEAGPPRVA